jgi:hypothetical protein
MYKVAVTETYATMVEIEAESEQDALQKAEDLAVEHGLEFNTCERDMAVVG